jgi:hypothetical protein
MPRTPPVVDLYSTIVLEIGLEWLRLVGLGWGWQGQTRFNPIRPGGIKESSIKKTQEPPPLPPLANWVKLG